MKCSSMMYSKLPMRVVSNAREAQEITQPRSKSFLFWLLISGYKQMGYSTLKWDGEFFPCIGLDQKSSTWSRIALAQLGFGLTLGSHSSALWNGIVNPRWATNNLYQFTSLSNTVWLTSFVLTCLFQGSKRSCCSSCGQCGLYSSCCGSM